MQNSITGIDSKKLPKLNFVNLAFIGYCGIFLLISEILYKGLEFINLYSLQEYGFKHEQRCPIESFTKHKTIAYNIGC